MTPMRRTAALLGALAAGAGPGSAPAQAPDTLSLPDAVRRALTSHPAVREAAAAARGAAAAVGEARAHWLPQLITTASFTRFEEPMIVFPLHGFDRPVEQIAFDRTLVQGNVSLAWTVWDGGLRGARIRGARAEAAGRDAALAGAEAELIAEVTRRYLAVLTARAVLDAQEDGLRALRAEDDRVARLVREGEAAEVAWLRVRAAQAQAEAERIGGVSEHEVALRSLARAVGAPSLAAPALAPVRLRETAPAPRDTLLAALADRNPRLAEARDAAEAARWSRRAAVAAWFPHLDAGGGVLGYGGAGDALTTEWQIGLRVSYPLFQGERGRAVSRAGAGADAAAARYQALRLDAEDALDRALSALPATRARVRAVESAVTHLAEVARIELLALQAGAGTEAEYLRAEADRRRARADLAEARAAEVSARVELARLTGDLSPAWLERNLETVR